MLKKQRGFSLIEIVVVVFLVAILALIIASLPQTVSSINKSRHASIARDIASKQVDYLRKQTYSNLPLGLNNFSDPNLSTLPQATATYEVSDCPLEVCAASEQLKEAVIRVSWNESGEPKNIELTTLIGQGGVGQ